MAQKPETTFRQGKVLPFLRSLKNTGIFPIQQIAIRGVPDFLLCCSGIFVGLELKAPGGKVSALQKFNLDKIEECGGVAIVAHPDNWPEVQRMLLRLDQGEKK